MMFCPRCGFYGLGLCLALRWPKSAPRWPHLASNGVSASLEPIELHRIAKLCLLGPSNHKPTTMWHLPCREPGQHPQHNGERVQTYNSMFGRTLPYTASLRPFVPVAKQKACNARGMSSQKLCHGLFAGGHASPRHHMQRKVWRRYGPPHIAMRLLRAPCLPFHQRRGTCNNPSNKQYAPPHC